MPPSRTQRTLIPVRFGPPLTAPTLHDSLAATLCLNYGRRVQTTEAAGRRSLFVELGHRWVERREGCRLKHPASKCRFRHCRPSSHHDPRELPSLRREETQAHAQLGLDG